MAIDGSNDATNDSALDELTDLGGESMAVEEDTGGGESDTGMSMLGSDTEQDNARESLASVLREIDGDGDPPDPDGELDSSTSDAVNYPEENDDKETPPVGSDHPGVQLVELFDSAVEIEGQIIEVEGTFETTADPSPSVEETAPAGATGGLGAAMVAGAVVAWAGRKAGDWWKSRKDSGEEDAPDEPGEDDRRKS